MYELSLWMSMSATEFALSQSVGVSHMCVVSVMHVVFDKRQSSSCKWARRGC
jgi:hypothetical protein